MEELTTHCQRHLVNMFCLPPPPRHCLSELSLLSLHVLVCLATDTTICPTTALAWSSYSVMASSESTHYTSWISSNCFQFPVPVTLHLWQILNNIDTTTTALCAAGILILSMFPCCTAVFCPVWFMIALLFCFGLPCSFISSCCCLNTNMMPKFHLQYETLVCTELLLYFNINNFSIDLSLSRLKWSLEVVHFGLRQSPQTCSYNIQSIHLFVVPLCLCMQPFSLTIGFQYISSSICFINSQLSMTKSVKIKLMWHSMAKSDIKNKCRD